MIKVRIKGFSFRDINTIWCFKVVASQDIVDIVHTTWSLMDLTEISWPDTPISVFGL